MGVAHRTAARIVKYGVTGGDPNGRLEMEQFPGTGPGEHPLAQQHRHRLGARHGLLHHRQPRQQQPGGRLPRPRHQPVLPAARRVPGASTCTARRAPRSASSPPPTWRTPPRPPTPSTPATGTPAPASSTSTSTRPAAAAWRVLMGGGRRWFLPSDRVRLVPRRRDGLRRPAGRRPGRRGTSRPPRPARATRPATCAPTSRRPASPTSRTPPRWPPCSRPPRKLLGLFGYGNMNVALDKIAKRRGTPAGRRHLRRRRLPRARPADAGRDDLGGPLGAVAERDGLRADGRGRAHRQAVAPHGRRPGHRRDARVRRRGRRGAPLRRPGRRHGGRRARRPRVLGLQPHRRAHRRGRRRPGAALRRGGAGPRLQAPARQRPWSAPTTRPASRATPSRPTATPPPWTSTARCWSATAPAATATRPGSRKPLPVIDSLLPRRPQGRAHGRRATPASRCSAPRDASGFFLRGQVAGGQAVHTAADIPVSAYSSGSDAWREFVGVQTQHRRVLQAGAGRPGRRSRQPLTGAGERRPVPGARRTPRSGLVQSTQRAHQPMAPRGAAPSGSGRGQHGRMLLATSQVLHQDLATRRDASDRPAPRGRAARPRARPRRGRGLSGARSR